MAGGRLRAARRALTATGGVAAPARLTVGRFEELPLADPPP